MISKRIILLLGLLLSLAAPARGQQGPPAESPRPHRHRNSQPRVIHHPPRPTLAAERWLWTSANAMCSR
jgi:hypothetical protein